MKLKNTKYISGITIPKYFSSKISVLANCEVTSDEVWLFNIAMQITSEQLYIDSIAKDELDITKSSSLNAIFTKNGEFTLLKDDNVACCGMQFCSVIYVLDFLREMQNERFSLFVYIEELVHHYWRIEDETEIKNKVLEIIQRFDKNVTYDMIKKWKLNGI